MAVVFAFIFGILTFLCGIGLYVTTPSLVVITVLTLIGYTEFSVLLTTFYLLAGCGLGFIFSYFMTALCAVVVAES